MRVRPLAKTRCDGCCTRHSSNMNCPAGTPSAEPLRLAREPFCSRFGASDRTAPTPQPLPGSALGGLQRALRRRWACRATGCAATDGALQVFERQRAAARACSHWPASTAVTSSASGPASSATGARSGSARSRRRIGPMEMQLKGAASRPTRAWATAAPCCARRSASSSARRRWTAARHPDRRARCASPARRCRCAAKTIETAAVVTRVAPSFIRFGHFEHFAHGRTNLPRCSSLADFVIDAPTIPNAARRAATVCWPARSGGAAHRRA